MIDSQYYEAQCYIRGTSLAAAYHYTNGAKSDYTYYVQNAHGDVVNLTDADGAVTKTYHSDAFGVEQNINAADTNAFRYCGEYYDAETGTIYLRARYYQVAIGRFTQRDSVTGKIGDPLSLNLYTYAHNNPIFYYDPSGHNALSKLAKTLKRDFIKAASQIKDSPKESSRIIKTSLELSRAKCLATSGKIIMNRVESFTSRYDIAYSKTEAIGVGTGFWSYYGVMGTCIDSKGNYGNIKTFSSGLEGGAPGIAGGKTYAITNVSNIDELGGFGMDLGAGGSIDMATIGGVISAVPEKNENGNMDITKPGIALFVGVGSPGAYCNVHWNYSWVQKNGNIFRDYDRFYELVMEYR